MPEIIKKITTFTINKLDSLSSCRHTYSELITRNFVKLNIGKKIMNQEDLKMLFAAAGIFTALGTVAICYKDKIYKFFCGPSYDTNKKEESLKKFEATILKQKETITSYESVLNQLKQIQVDDDVLKHLNTLGISNYNDDTISIDIVDRAYRHIALKFHPDKNGITDGFNAISKAKESLHNKTNKTLIMKAKNIIEELEESNALLKDSIAQSKANTLRSTQIKALIEAMDEKEHTNDDPPEVSEEETNHYQYNTFR